LAGADYGCIFGLVYIDLRRIQTGSMTFTATKVGDLYLQEVAQRIRRGQLRSWAICWPGSAATNLRFWFPRSTVVQRLRRSPCACNRCFEEPYFAAEDCVVEGSASIGFAMYPEDARSRDDLLSAGRCRYVRDGAHAAQTCQPSAPPQG